MRLAICHECGLIFNTAFEPSLLEYGECYENTLHFSTLFQEYARSLAERLVERYNLRGRDIIEIGCGKGDFLLMLCTLGGNRGVGFDPSFEERPSSGSNGIEVRFVKDRYGVAYAHYSADIILSRQMLEHVPDPGGLLAAIRSAIGERSTPLVVEVPNALHMLRNRVLWDIIYEHCSYFAPVSLSALCSICGFDVMEISEEFGGQYLLLHAAPARGAARGAGGRDEGVDRLIEEAERFRASCRRSADDWRETIEQMLREGRRIVLWGAGSKGVTFASTLGLGGRISSIVDVNPNKWGKYIAGSGLRVIPPRELSGHPPDIIVIMNSIYEEEIRALTREIGIRPRLVAV